MTPSFIAECLSYDPATGEIRWKERPREHFANEAAYKTHARRKAGELAGCVDDSTGYLVIGLSNKLLYGHRVAWAISHGEWPDQQIDHINGRKLDNRAENLRCVSQAENSRNSTAKRIGSCDIAGVGFAKRERKWRARIMLDYRDIHLGYFDTMEEAAAARSAALVTHGFHPNHGRPA
jgi:hypothetical protein